MVRLLCGLCSLVVAASALAENYPQSVYWTWAPDGHPSSISVGGLVANFDPLLGGYAVDTTTGAVLAGYNLGPVVAGGNEIYLQVEQYAGVTVAQMEANDYSTNTGYGTEVFYNFVTATDMLIGDGSALLAGYNAGFLSVSGAMMLPDSPGGALVGSGGGVGGGTVDSSVVGAFDGVNASSWWEWMVGILVAFFLFKLGKRSLSQA
jgi:hypothetical protein